MRLFLVSILLGLAQQTYQSLVVETQHGTVKGRFDVFTKTDYFYGIPYGADTGGEGRFKPPTAPKKWSGVKELDVLQPPMCPQVHAEKNEWFGKEDCLTIDVFRPSFEETRLSNLTVMVWIYGGAYVIGSADQLNIYNGKDLAKNYNAIVVSMNYRVNNLGFLALPSLFAESNTTGNYALLDQQFALKWVKNNIEKFGGNPSNVMLFGQSAGGCSVTAQLSMPGSAGLFHSAAIHSPLPVSDVSWISYKNATSFGELYAEQVGCPNNSTQLTCLRSLPLSTLLNAVLEWRFKFPKTDRTGLPRLMPLMAWWPVIDGTVLPDTPINLASTSKGFHDVPIILGNVDNEGSIFMPMIPFIVGGDVPVTLPLSASGLKRTLLHFFNETVVDSAVAFYGKRGITSERTASLIIRDFFFECPARFLTRSLLSNPSRKSPVFSYHFNQTISSDLYKEFGDYHTCEVPFAFNLVNQFRKWTPEETALSNKMAGLWTSFARTNGHPSCPTCPQWPAYALNDNKYLSLETPTTVKTNLNLEACDYWDKWGYVNNPQ
eukprot:TRINITY_DN5088_c0_g1_i1.p1 TRINITY_DN5088_c0_g1~~TRINITY_DN5088_c0_g1_i1.p1  ORF type:complete len:565 (+),score=61.39 TRINITY_DN5088_c0_g1_i1:59-1696(+)